MKQNFRLEPSHPMGWPKRKRLTSRRMPPTSITDLLDRTNRLGNSAITLTSSSVDAIAVDTRSSPCGTAFLALVVAVFEIERVNVTGDITMVHLVSLDLEQSTKKPIYPLMVVQKNYDCVGMGKRCSRRYKQMEYAPKKRQAQVDPEIGSTACDNKNTDRRDCVGS
jgi:hypothetical protein